MAEAVYILCAFTSTACAVLLVRGYLNNTRSKLLLWSSLCFVFFALNNILLYVDLVIFPEGPDLALLRSISGLAGIMILLYGLVWETT
jgi:hypothetical protein